MTQPQPIGQTPANKYCAGCRRWIQVVLNTTFNCHSRQPDGLQPFCRECDTRQKFEPEKRYPKFEYAMKQRGKGEECLWTLHQYLTLMHDFLCHYCKGSVLEWGGGYGVDKLNPRGCYEPSNCVACCGPCNRTKLDMGADSFIHLIRDVLSRYPAGKVPWDTINPKYKRNSAAIPDLSRYVVVVQLGLFGKKS